MVAIDARCTAITLRCSSIHIIIWSNKGECVWISAKKRFPVIRQIKTYNNLLVIARTHCLVYRRNQRDSRHWLATGDMSTRSAADPCARSSKWINGCYEFAFISVSHQPVWFNQFISCRTDSFEIIFTSLIKLKFYDCTYHIWPQQIDWYSTIKNLFGVEFFG